ncbi:MAG: hypothetical protein KAT69_10720 [Candidatus Aminicenantes bacterium]|nr:hypothetical protein [Candidatus Aminicenantes bacterium]
MLPCRALFLNLLLELCYSLFMILEILIEDLNVLRGLINLAMALGQAELHLINLEFQKDKYK